MAARPKIYFHSSRERRNRVFINFLMSVGVYGCFVINNVKFLVIFHNFTVIYCNLTNSLWYFIRNNTEFL